MRLLVSELETVIHALDSQFIQLVEVIRKFSMDGPLNQEELHYLHNFFSNFAVSGKASFEALNKATLESEAFLNMIRGTKRFTVSVCQSKLTV